MPEHLEAFEDFRDADETAAAYIERVDGRSYDKLAREDRDRVDLAQDQLLVAEPEFALRIAPRVEPVATDESDDRLIAVKVAFDIGWSQRAASPLPPPKPCGRRTHARPHLRRPRRRGAGRPAQRRARRSTSSASSGGDPPGGESEPAPAASHDRGAA